MGRVHCWCWMWCLADAWHLFYHKAIHTPLPLNSCLHRENQVSLNSVWGAKWGFTSLFTDCIRLGTAAHTFNLSTWEAEAGIFVWVQSQPSPHGELGHPVWGERKKQTNKNPVAYLTYLFVSDPLSYTANQYFSLFMKHCEIQVFWAKK